jgi:hypothetical protein
MTAIRHHFCPVEKSRSQSGKQEYLYYFCNGHSPLTVGRATQCRAKNVRADRLDEIVWQALCQLLRQPNLIPQLHRTWVEAKQQSISTLEAQQSQLRQRRQRIERQTQRLLDAYQAEIIGLSELQSRRQKLSSELQQIDQEARQLTVAQQQTIHWQQVIDNAESFHKLLGDNLEQLSFEDRQAVAQCLISKTIVTGEEVDIHFVLPFESSPQAVSRQSKEPEGAPGQFYRLRLAHLHPPASHEPSQNLRRRMREIVRQQHLWLKLTHRITDQHPTDRDWHIPAAVPDGGLGIDFDFALLSAVPMIDLDLRPLRFRIVEYLLGRRSARAFHSWASSLPGFSFWRRVVKLGVESQPHDHIYSWRAADKIKQIQDSETAIADEDKIPVRRPSSYQSNDLPGAIGQPLMPSLLPLVKALGRAQNRRERQAPDAACPRDLDQEHRTQPAEPARLDEMRLRGANRIAIDAFSLDLRSAPAFDRVVNPDDQFAAWSKGRDQYSEQHLRSPQRRPSRTIEHAMIVLKALVLAVACHTQTGRDSAFADGQNSPNQQGFRALPNRFGEKRALSDLP